MGGVKTQVYKTALEVFTITIIIFCAKYVHGCPLIALHKHFGPTLSLVAFTKGKHKVEGVAFE